MNGMTEFFFLMKHELSLVLILVFLLILKIRTKPIVNSSLINVMNVVFFLNFILGWFLNKDGSLFGGMFLNSGLLAFEKNILNLGTFIICLQASSWLKDHKHVPEFYMLLISTLIGMFFMLSSGNLLMFYLGLELSTIPLAAMCNFDMEKANSSEAAMKMIMSSAFSSGILLFGISLFYGMTGTFSLLGSGYNFDGSPLQVLSFLMLFSGFAFKLSVVPFHFWTADVYEGSLVSVTSYLSVISKGAMVFVFSSVMYTTFKGIATVWYDAMVVLSILTMVVGNLFALRQNNMKRFLAFSSIAQVGYILIGISGSSESGMASSIYFILIYIFSNLGAFGVISLISSETGRESIDDYKGLYKTNPMLGWVLALSLFSLAGIPPTAGFFGKIFLLTAGAAKGNYLLITIASLNMIVSLYYYLRVIRAVFMDSNENAIEPIKSQTSFKLAIILCVAGILVTGFANGLYEYILSLSHGM